jgi:AraC-like DNA-binding protein
MFNYSEIPAPAALKGYLRKFWIINNLQNSSTIETKYALPNGCFTIAFINIAGVTLQYDKQSIPVSKGIYLFGQINTRLKIIVQPHTKAIMAQLTPWSASLITNFPLNELTNNFIDLKLVNTGLYQKFQNINYLDEHLLFAEFCKAFEDLGSTGTSNIIKSIYTIFENKYTRLPLNMADVAAQTGYSKRYIEKKFNTHIGISPGDYYAILRLRNLINELDDAGNQLSLGRLAYKHGYFDQSHFIKAYSKVMGSLPKQFDSTDYILPFNN